MTRGLSPLRKAELLLLAAIGFALPLRVRGVGVRALAANRKLAAMTKAAVAAKVHQALDVHRNFAAQIAFHEVVAVNRLADLEHFGVGELGHAALGGMFTFSQISSAFFAPMP